MDVETDEFGLFLDAIASRRVAPAGGSAAAFAGGLGAALAEMAVIHTRDKQGDSAEEELVHAQERLAHQRDALVTLADEDARAIDALFGKSTLENEQAALSRATGVPLSIAEACVTVLEISLDVSEHLAASVRQDFQTGLYLTFAAFEAAIRTADGNLDLLDDAAIQADMADRLSTARQTGTTAMDRLSEETGLARFF